MYFCLNEKSSLSAAFKVTLIFSLISIKVVPFLKNLRSF